MTGTEEMTLREFMNFMDFQGYAKLILISMLIFTGALGKSKSEPMIKFISTVIKTIGYYLLFLFFIKQLGLDTPLDSVTLFTIFVCFIELVINIIDILHYIIGGVRELIKVIIMGRTEKY